MGQVRGSIEQMETIRCGSYLPISSKILKTHGKFLDLGHSLYYKQRTMECYKDLQACDDLPILQSNAMVYIMSHTCGVQRRGADPYD